MIQPDDAFMLFDFGNPGSVNDWAAIDDRVMGGVSRSRLRYDPEGHAVFEGQVSLERNGGFASVRSSPGARGKPGAVTCAIEVRGGGKQFKLNLLTDDGFDSLNYQCGFTPNGDDWQTIQLPLRAFRATFSRTRRAGRAGARLGTDPPGRADDRSATGRPFCSRHPAHEPGLNPKRRDVAEATGAQESYSLDLMLPLANVP